MARRLVTIEKLIERALEKGEGNLNGRKRDYGYVGALEEKYNETEQRYF